MYIKKKKKKKRRRNAIPLTANEKGQVVEKECNKDTALKGRKGGEDRRGWKQNVITDNNLGGGVLSEMYVIKG